MVRKRYGQHRVINTALNDNCVLYQGYIAPNGYGIRTLYGRQMNAHHATWLVQHGLDALPKGMLVGHTCDNRACIRNDTKGVYTVAGTDYPRSGHLWLGTAEANALDMATKGRWKNQSTFTQEDIDSIRNLRNMYSAIKIARMYNVHRNTIHKILSSETYTTPLNRPKE